MKQVVSFLFIVCCSASTLWSQDPVIVDETIARVNRDIITRSVLQREETKLRHEVEERYRDNPAQMEAEFKRLSRLLLRSLIEERLIAQKADEIGINVEAEINQALVEICKQNNFPSVTDCQTAMERQGISIDELKSNYRSQLLRRELLSREVYGPTLDKITEREKQVYYEKHKGEYTEPGHVSLSEIYVGFTPDTMVQAETKIRAAAAELKSGKDFCEVVKKYSDDRRSSKAKCGATAPLKDDEVAVELRQEIEKVGPGQVTQVLRFKNSFQIFRLDSRVAPKQKNFEEIVSEIGYRIATERSSDKVRTYFKDLRDKAFIKLAPEYKGIFEED